MCKSTKASDSSQPTNVNNPMSTKGQSTTSLNLKIDIAETNLNAFLTTMITNEKPNNNSNRSWEHCYKLFGAMHDPYQQAVKQKNSASLDNITNYLALHLGFYLASWGMYRGSAFIRNYDYTIHRETVKIVFDHWDLRNWDLFTIGDLTNSKTKMFYSLLGELYNHYYHLKDHTQNKELKIDTNNFKSTQKLYRNAIKDVSDTLITKIILGTLGCVPAYDTYLKATMSMCNTGTLKDSFPESLTAITDYWQKYSNDLQDVFNKVYGKNDCLNNYVNYPPMKIMDMVLFQTGIVIKKGEEHFKQENQL